MRNRAGCCRGQGLPRHSRHTEQIVHHGARTDGQRPLRIAIAEVRHHTLRHDLLGDGDMRRIVDAIAEDDLRGVIVEGREQQHAVIAYRIAIPQ